MRYIEIKKELDVVVSEIEEALEAIKYGNYGKINTVTAKYGTRMKELKDELKILQN